jgi:hypothetical protein
MANGYGNFRSGSSADGTIVGAKKIPGAINGAKKRVFVEKFDLSKATVAKVVADKLLVANIPAGHAILSINVRSTVSLTTSTLAFGDGTTANKFGTAAVYGTTPEVDKEYLKTSEKGEPLAADTNLWATIAVADLPGAGIVVVEVETAAR